MTQIVIDVPAGQWPGVMADVAAALGRRAAAVREDVYHVILREIPQLRDDKPLLALLAASVDNNVDTCLQIMQHRIDLTAVAAPAAAVEYARRLAQRGTPLAEPERGPDRPGPRPAGGRADRVEHGGGDPRLPAAPVPRRPGVLGGRRHRHRRRDQPARARGRARGGASGVFGDPVFLQYDESSAWAWLRPE